MKKIIIEIFSALYLVFLAFIWWGIPNKELVWFALPAAGLMRQIGGTYSHTVGRFFYVAVFGMACLFFLGWSWWIPLIVLAYFAAKTLPFTLIGDSLHDSWFNWIWIWILGFITGLPVVFVGIWTGQVGLSLLLCIIPAVTVGLLGTLSNIKQTASFFLWKWCEFCFGCAVAFPLCMVIQRAV